jgi:signal transduction histidine kinase
MNNSSDKLINVISRNIKHDLKNPINAILGYSDLLLDLLDIDFPTIEDDIKSIHESGNIILSNINILFSKNSLDTSSILDIIKNYNFQHSFRTPLTTIIGLAEFLIEDKLYNNSHNKSDIEDSLDRIAKAGKELLKLINNLNYPLYQIYYVNYYKVYLQLEIQLNLLL